MTSDASDVIDISDEDTPPVEIVETLIKTVDVKVKDDEVKDEKECGVPTKEIKSMEKEMKTVKEGASENDERGGAKETYAGDDAKMDVESNVGLTRGQICDIIGVSVHDESRDETNVAKKPRVTDVAEGKSSSGGYEENFMKFIAVGDEDNDKMDTGMEVSFDEAETSERKRLDVVEYLDEIDGKILTVFVEPRPTADETRGDEKEGNERDKNELRRSSQESTTTTTNTTTTLTTSSEDDTSDSDSSESTSSSESDSSGSGEADASVETVVEVKKKEAAVEVEKEAVVEVKKEAEEAGKEAAVPKQENVVLGMYKI